MAFEQQALPGPRSSRTKGTLLEYLGQHWRGELTLATAFWLNFVALALIPATLLAIASGSVGKLGLRSNAVIMLAAWAMAYAILLWQFVGAFRSTKNHVKRGGSKIGAACGWLGLILVVGGNVFFAAAHLIPWASEQASIARGDERIPRLVMELLPSGREVELTGGLPAGCALQFVELLSNAPAVNVVHVNNGGGRVHEALEIAKVVRAREMTTYVSLHCESAATLIFLAGRERFVANGAKIGFHSGSFPGLSSGELSLTNSLAREAMIAAKVDAPFIRRALDTPSSEMWYPSVEEMVGAGIATNVTHGERFGISQTVARQIQQKGLAGVLPYWDKLRKAAPDLYAEINSAYRAGASTGLSEGEIGTRARAIITARVNASIPCASDEALRHLVRFWLLMLGKYKDTQAKEIVNFFESSTAGSTSSDMNMARVFKDYPADEEIAVLVEVVTSASSGVRPIDKAAAERDLEVVTKKLANDAPDAAVAIASTPKTPAEYTLKANGFWTFYDTIRTEVPELRQANLLRHLLTEEPNKPADQPLRTQAVAATQPKSLPQSPNVTQSLSDSAVVNSGGSQTPLKNGGNVVTKPKAVASSRPSATGDKANPIGNKRETLGRTDDSTRGYFTVGSTKDEVLAVQGSPSSFTDSVFNYGTSEVIFRGGRVTSWNSLYPVLKAKLEQARQ